MEETVRQRWHVQGVVQGVGFRPWIFRLANLHRLAGWVTNNSSGVLIELEGSPESVAAFQRDFQTPPPLARIEHVATEDCPPLGESLFRIAPSEHHGEGLTNVSPDVATCPQCMAEFLNPTDRRHAYPFINCTNCGPRFTITRATPYDRAQTTMSAFPLCEDCAREYNDPADRRFHAQPNACPICGPHLWFERGPTESAAWLEASRASLRAGEILAVKGIGGFHLACDARNDTAVGELRRRKGRSRKPFAVMVHDLATAHRYVELSPESELLLTSAARPIVLLPARPHSDISALVAPGNSLLGVFVPYTPLHHALTQDGPLLMTSGNRSDEPIVCDNNEARRVLPELADAFLMHNRPIHIFCDDSVVAFPMGRELPVRRSRGYAPLPVHVPALRRSVLAAGGELKSTLCLATDESAYLSQHIGDMQTLETQNAFERAARHLESLYRIAPQGVACDLHPGYLSTLWAKDEAHRRGIPLIQVQHHHAHGASLMAESGFTPDQRMIVLAFDGTGYGTDGAIWGGEVLLCGFHEFTRLAHFDYFPLPGGDAAIRYPQRTATAWLLSNGFEVDANPILIRQIERNLNCIPTSSLGRIFDAVASLLNICQEVTFEGEAAILLEAAARASNDTATYKMEWANSKCLIAEILADRKKNVPAATIARRFHTAVANAMRTACQAAREATGLTDIGLTGGVFQNGLLLELAIPSLEDAGFTLYTHHVVPANDGGLSLGQAVIAGLR
jgi:hydrogenase maturation protein HypF